MVINNMVIYGKILHGKIKEIQDLVNNGYSIAQSAAKLGYEPSYIYTFLSRTKIKIDFKGKRNKANWIHKFTYSGRKSGFRNSDEQKRKSGESIKKGYIEGRIQPFWLGRERLDYRGKNHPNWKGGKVKYKRLRTSEWLILRDKIMLRDNYICQNCETKNNKLNVHHIIPYRISEDNSEENLLTLCVSCHTKIENNLEKGIEIFYNSCQDDAFNSMIENKGKCGIYE